MELREKIYFEQAIKYAITLHKRTNTFIFPFILTCNDQSGPKAFPIVAFSVDPSKRQKKILLNQFIGRVKRKKKTYMP